MLFRQKGMTLIEALLIIAMLGGAVAIFGAVLNVMRLNQAGGYAAAAYRLAEEEVDILRAKPLVSLSARTSSTPIGVLYNNGNYGAAADGAAVSAPQALVNNAASSSPLGIIALPYANLTDFTFEASLKTTSTERAAGLLFRARDLDNYYFFYLQNNQIVLDKRAGGAASTLYSAGQTFSPATWYKLKIVAAGGNLSLYLNDNLLTTVSDNSISSGFGALANQGGIASFDNAALIHNLLAETWNFDDILPGALPHAWLRRGINDLPEGTVLLSISEPYGTPTIKKIDVAVSWKEKGQTRTITLSTLKTE